MSIMMDRLTLHYQFVKDSDNILVSMTFPVLRYHNRIERIDDYKYEESIMVVIPSFPLANDMRYLSLKTWRFNSEGSCRSADIWPLTSFYDNQQGELILTFKKETR